MMTFHNSYCSGKLSMSQRAKSFHPVEPNFYAIIPSLTIEEIKK